MSAPTFSLWIVPQSNQWTVTLLTIANADTLLFNGTTFTAETSWTATNDEFGVGATDAETAVYLATAINASSDLVGPVTAYPTGPFTLALNLNAADTLIINGNALVCENGTATGANQFNIGTDHGASELAALINLSDLSGIAGLLSAAVSPTSSTTVILTGQLTTLKGTGMSTGRATCVASSAAIKIVGAFSSFSYTVAASTTQALRALCAPQAPFTVIANVTGGSADDTIKSTYGAALAHGANVDGTPFSQGSTPLAVTTTTSIPVAASAAVPVTWDAVGYAYQLDGSQLDYDYEAYLTFLTAGNISATAPLPIVTIVCPDLSYLSAGDT